MSRYSQDVEIRSQRVRELHDVGTVGSVGSLRLRVRGTTVDAYVPIASSFTSPPTFSGEITGDGAALTGRIKESFAGALWQRADAFVLIILFAMIVLGVVDTISDFDGGGLAPLLIGVVGAPIFAGLYIVHRRQRSEEWQVRAGKLRQELTRYVDSC